MLVSLIISSDTIVKISSNKLIGSFHSVKKINSLRKKHWSSNECYENNKSCENSTLICLKSVMLSKTPKDIVKYVEYN